MMVKHGFRFGMTLAFLALSPLWILTEFMILGRIKQTNREIGPAIKVLGENNVYAESQGGGLDIKASVVVGDSRPIILKNFLEKYRSPLAQYSDLIYKVSEERGIDYRYIPAIAMVESNLCKTIPIAPYSYNCWGIGVHSRGTLRFSSFEEAIVYVGDYIKNELYSRGYDTPEKIMEKYCPFSNGSWAFGIKHFMEEMQ